MSEADLICRERRRYPRQLCKVCVQIRDRRGCTSFYAVTQEISLCGCYVETMFPLEVGTKVSLSFSIGDRPVRADGVVVTRYPLLGNGFDFTDMTTEDRLAMNAFLSGQHRDCIPVIKEAK